MLILGIDPAPKKPAILYDGQGRPGAYAFSELRRYRSRLSRSSEKVLVCWYAPLSGPRHTSPDDPRVAGEFSTRPIDAFFGRQKHGFKTPRGISVLPYSSCSHWAVSRALLGLPRVEPFDADWEDLPFCLVSLADDPVVRHKLIAEVHPALALWLWCREDLSSSQGWQYKGDKETVEYLGSDLCRSLASK